MLKTAMRRAPATVIRAALLAALGLAPALADPAVSSASGGCWRPGTAPDLFAWSASPGIACRDSADSFAPSPVAPATTVSTADSASPNRDETATEFTFSGSAYVGIAVAF